ncbi:MAG: ABC transporter permease [Actinomycetia bacterium]|nr:ABC transporter permease [Actinomycetes bacterium]
MFANTAALCRLIFRRDRISMLLWFIGLTVLVVGFGSAIKDMYPSAVERSIAVEAMKNPAMIAIMGPVNVEDITQVSIGEIYALYLTLWTALFVAAMNILHMVRHTRQDEEAGYLEVVRSHPVGRLSNLASAFVTALLLNGALALAMSIGLALLGTEGIDLAGSLLYGAAIGAVGMVFAAITAIICQITSSARTAQALSFGYLAFDFVLRAIGDVRDIDLLSLLSPLGIVVRISAFGANRWWPVLVLGALAITGAAIAFWLSAIRDVDAGLIPARPGRSEASAQLSSPAGLAWRLLRVPAIVWAISIFVLGMSYGTVMGDLEGFIESNEVLRELFTGDPMQFITYVMIVLTITGTIPILQFILKARSQENEGYAENTLVRAASRTQQLAGYFLIAAAACVLVPFLNALGLWAGSYPVMKNPIPLLTMLKASMVYAPALLFMLGVAMLLIGFFPRQSIAAWIYLGYAFIVLYFGQLFNVPEWLAKLSPYGYMPQLPVDEYRWLPIFVVVSLALVMFALGFIGHRRRDMEFIQ